MELEINMIRELKNKNYQVLLEIHNSDIEEVYNRIKSQLPKNHKKRDVFYNFVDSFLSSLEMQFYDILENWDKEEVANMFINWGEWE